MSPRQAAQVLDVRLDGLYMLIWSGKLPGCESGRPVADISRHRGEAVSRQETSEGLRHAFLTVRGRRGDRFRAPIPWAA